MEKKLREQMSSDGSSGGDGNDDVARPRSRRERRDGPGLSDVLTCAQGPKKKRRRRHATAAGPAGKTPRRRTQNRPEAQKQNPSIAGHAQTDDNRRFEKSTSSFPVLEPI